MAKLPKPEWCRSCVLYGDGTGFSNLEGTGQLPLLVIAEALGENEEDDGLPLRPDAPAGAIFQRALREAGIPRNSLALTNIIRCRPPGNELLGTPHERAAISQCSHYLDAAVAHYRPRAILALGGTPLRELTDYEGILTYRGFILPSRYGIPVVATYHPALLARGALGTLFGVFKRDIALAVDVARNGLPNQLETNYELVPSIGTVHDYLRYLVDNSLLPISYDIESAGILGEKEPEDWRLKRIIQIQFSTASGHAIVLPWEGEYAVLARRILALPNGKWGWNSRLSDDIVLRANGCTIGGETHDLMLAWQHLQPDFASQKDGAAHSSDAKEFTARLMNLQSCASFYCPEVSPWKHRAAEDLQYYGARDADITYRCGVGIFASLHKQGLMAGYIDHKFRLRKVLDDMGARGLPINRTKQAEVRNYAAMEITRLQSEIQTLVPMELRSIHPAAGYKSLAGKVQVAGAAEKVALKTLIGDYDGDNPPLLEYSNFSGHLMRGTRASTSSAEPSCEDWWYVAKLFNVGSSDQLLRYIRHRGYRVPKRLDDPEKDTTGKDELAKLAKETGDPLLKTTDTYRKFVKLAGSYTGKVAKDGTVIGDWVPGTDGRVHPTFRWGTGSGQLSCANPNAQQFPEHGPLAKRAKEMIVAERGHTFVKIDMRGFHARMIGFLAEDAAYYKLADFDVHSYVTAHYLRLHDAPYLLEMSDDELRAALKAVKRDHEHTRNFKVKRVVHGSQFGMGVNKLYNMHGPDLDPTPEAAAAVAGAKWATWNLAQQAKFVAQLGRKEAQHLLDLLRDLFPATFDINRYSSFPARIARQIREGTPLLKSPFHHVRYFWDWDKEKSTAYLPSNCSHCHIQYGLLDLDALGALDHYELVNFTHDAVWYHCPDALVSECIEVTKRVFERESTVLYNRWGAFQCNSDAEIGPHLAAMHAV